MTQAQATTINLASLRQPVSLRAALAEIRRSRVVWRIALFIIGLAFVVPFIIIITLITIGNVNTGGIMMCLFFWLMGWLGGRDMIKETRKNIVLRRFAAANGWGFACDVIDDSYPAKYFRTRFVRIADMIRSPGQLFFELGNFRIVGQVERSSKGPTYGYIRIKLPRRLPNIMLQSKAPGALPLPGSPDPNQRLSLEGNWDDYFTLYAPKDYERDALYIFTPDVMQKFMDEVGQFNSEIIEDEIYFFSQNRLDLTKQAVITNLIGLVANVVQKFDHQIDYYSDERVGCRQANAIAQPGQRLQNSQLLRWFWRIVTVLMLALLVFGAYSLIRQAMHGHYAPLSRMFASLLITMVLAYVIGAAARWWQRRQ